VEPEDVVWTATSALLAFSDGVQRTASSCQRSLVNVTLVPAAMSRADDPSTSRTRTGVSEVSGTRA